MKNYLLPIALFGSISLVSHLKPALALSPVEVQRIAKQTTIQIAGCDMFGSGVIIRKNGNTYTVLTVAHNMNYPQPASLGWGFCRFVETSCLNPPQLLGATHAEETV
jgi:hypothetical protein